jgi:hypothetical protein
VRGSAGGKDNDKGKGKKSQEMAVAGRKDSEQAQRRAKETERILSYVRGRLSGAATPGQLREELFEPVPPSAVRQFVKNLKAWSREVKDAALVALQAACARGESTELKYALWDVGRPTLLYDSRRDVRVRLLTDGFRKSLAEVLWTDKAAFEGGGEAQDTSVEVDSDDEDDTVCKAWKDLPLGEGVSDEQLCGLYPAHGWHNGGVFRADDAEALELLEVQRRVMHGRVNGLEKQSGGAVDASSCLPAMELQFKQGLPAAAMMLGADVRRRHTEELVVCSVVDDVAFAAARSMSEQTPPPSDQPSDAARNGWWLHGGYVRLSDDAARHELRAPGPLVACVTPARWPTRMLPGVLPAVTFYCTAADAYIDDEVLDELDREGLLVGRGDVPSWDSRHVSCPEPPAALGDDQPARLVDLLYGNAPPTAEQLKAADGTPEGLAVKQQVRRDVLLALRILCEDDLLTIRAVHAIKRFVALCVGKSKLVHRPLHVAMHRLSTLQAVHLAHYVQFLWFSHVAHTREWQELEDLRSRLEHKQFVSLRRCPQGDSDDWLIHINPEGSGAPHPAAPSDSADAAAGDRLLDDVQYVLSNTLDVHPAR